MTSAPAGIRQLQLRSAGSSSRQPQLQLRSSSVQLDVGLLLATASYWAVCGSAQCAVSVSAAPLSAVRSPQHPELLGAGIQAQAAGRWAAVIGRCISVPRRAHMVCYHSHWVVIGAHWAFGTWDIMTYGHAPDAPCTVRHVYANAGAILFYFFKHNHRLHIPPLVIGTGNSRS
jgi:hypothetical protein